MSSLGDGIKREWRLILFIIGLILVFWILWALRTVLLPFIIGLIFAYMLLPVIRWIERRLPALNRKQRIRNFLRIITILIVYIFTLGIIGLLIFYIVNVARDTFSNIEVDFANLIPNGINTIKEWIKSFPFLSSPSSQTAIDNYAQQVNDALPGLITNFLSSGLKILQGSASTIISFLITPIFMFFILKDWEKIRDGFYGGMSPWLRERTEGVFKILSDVVVRYIRGELLLGLVVGSLVYIMLLILGNQFALPLAIVAGLTELVPMIGPWIGGALGVLVTLALSPEKALWVAIGYVAIQLLENNFLVPRIQGSQMEIHPAFVIILTLLGAYFAGILGFIVILPATMTIIRLIKYFRDSVGKAAPLDEVISDDYLPPDEM